MADYDASQTGSTAADTGPIARPDVDTLPAGSFGPATGNAITGAGTVTGAAGADTPGAAPAAIVEVHGAGGPTAANGDSFQAAGQYGALSIDAQGNFNYVRNPGTPDGVKDVFGYTLADAQGARSPSTLTIDIGQVATAAGIVNLPAGVELSDIHVVGRDLVVNMPDGTQMVIPGGAVFVPQLVIGDVSVPPSNVAALLIDSEPQPAAGPPQSSGGNFAADVPPLDPGVPLGDLIPPTELSYIPPDFEPEGQFIDRKPTILIETPDNPAGAVDAHDQVDEAGLPARTIDGVGEPQGSDAASDSEGTTGTIVFVAQDGLDSITVNGVEVTADSVGDTIQGQFGTLTITSVNLASGQIGYTYAIADNTNPGGDNNADHFTVVVTDSDGDVATGTLTVDIIDDTPTANNDTDSTDTQTGVAEGNVITAAGTTSSGADVVGADNAHVSAVSSNNVAGHSDSDATGGFIVDGEFGQLTLNPDGSYNYVLHDNAPGGSVDVFTYTLTDGDGDTETATLTINNPDHAPTIVVETPDNPAGAVNATESVDEKGLPARGSEPEGSGEAANPAPNTDNSETNTGTIVFSAQDGVDNVKVNGTAITTVGQVIHGTFGDMTITGINLASGEITYSYTLLDNTSGNNTQDVFSVSVTDTDGDVATGSLTVHIIDDVPTANPDTDALIDNNPTTDGNVITGTGTTSSPGGIDVVGADDAHVTSVTGTDGTDNSFNEDGNLVIHGDFGTLTIDADGNYTYTRDADAKAAGTDTFHYTITDGDGDPSTSTLTITLPNINSIPQIGEAENLTVDEDGLTAVANPDDGQTDPTEADHGGNVVDSGTVNVDFGNDEPASPADAIAFTNPGALDGQLTQGGEPITFSIDGSGNLIGQVNGVGDAVVTIEFTTTTQGTDGNVTYGYDVTLSGPVDQATADQTEDGITLTGVQFNVTDSDGEHAATPGSFDVTIYDDVPSVDVTKGSDANIVLETQDSQTIAGASDTDSSSANFGGVFGLTSEAGADGATTPSLSFTLGAVDHTDSGLTQTGSTIYLYELADGSVVGSTAGSEGAVDSGNTVFSVTVDADGIVTLTQFSQIDHPAVDDPDGTDAPFADQSVHLADGAITLTASATITDNDGDHATDSETVNIGANILFDDDGPSVSNPLAGDGVNLDETTAGSPDGFPISATSDTAAITATTASGADTPASTAYGLTITDSASGLATAIGDHPITLVQIDADTIEGQYQDGGTQTAFTIDIDSNGKITVTQDVPLEHLDPDNANDSLDLTGHVSATITVTDYDGDTATGSAPIGDNIVFFDDGPSINVTKGSDANIVLETQDSQTIAGASDTDSSSANFGGVFAIGSSSGGGDGAASTPALTFTLGAVDHTDSGLTQTGSTIYLYELADGSVVGSTAGSEGAVDSGNTVFSVTVDADGIVTLTQFSQIDHPAVDDPDGTDAPFADQSVHLADGAITLTASATITDNDGDHATDSETVNIGANILFDDDGPTVTNVQGASSITFDETSVGDITGWPATSVTSAAAMITATTTSGADTPASTAYGLALSNGLTSESTTLQTAQGDHAITLVQIDADTIQGQYQDGGTQVAFILDIGADGKVTYTQNVPLEHSDDGSTAIAYNDTNSPLDLSGLVQATITVTDYDGDTATGSTEIGDQIHIFDDGPSAVNPDSIVTTDEVQGPLTASLDLPDNDVTDNFGADGPGTITFANIADGDDSGLTSGGSTHHITYWLSDDGQTLEGRVDSTDGTDGSLVFSVAIDQDNSQYIYNQFDTIDNGSGVSFSDLSGGVAGNPPFKLITEPGESIELLATPINGGSINSDQDDMGVDSQFIDTTAGADKGVRLDFGDFTYEVNGGGTADDAFDMESHATVNGFRFTIDQVSNGTTADVHLRAIDADEDGGVEEQAPNPAGDVTDPITEVKIWNGTTLVADFHGSGTINGYTATFSGGEVTIDDLPAGYSIQTYTADGYDRIEITNPGNDSSSDTDGKFSISQFTIETTNTGSQIDLSYDLQVTDSDGDFTTVPGAINIELDPTGAQSTAVVNTLAVTNSSISTQDVSHTLVSTNDNHRTFEDHRGFNNAALIGAIAGAGLTSATQLAAATVHHEGFRGGHSGPIMAPQSHPAADLAAHDQAAAQSVSAQLGQGSVADHQLVTGHFSLPIEGGKLHGLAGNEQVHQVMTQLLHGTDAPALAGHGASPMVTAAAIAMPSAQQLAALSPATAGTQHSVAGSQHNEVVGKVLVDSLHGGAGHGPNLDALINALPGHGGQANALAALASHGDGAVSFGHNSVFASFTAGHNAPIMEHMMMHQDAPAHT